MSNYHITAFDGFNFAQTGAYAVSGTVGFKKARYQMIHPPHGIPLDTYAGADAPIEYKTISAKCLFTGDPDDVDTMMVALGAKVGVSGTLTGKAGSGTSTMTARLVELSGDWDGKKVDSETQWLFFTAIFQPMTDWS